MSYIVVALLRVHREIDLRTDEIVERLKKTMKIRLTRILQFNTNRRGLLFGMNIVF